MDGTFQIVLIITMVFVALMCGFSVFLLIREIVKEKKQKNNPEQNDMEREYPQYVLPPAYVVAPQVETSQPLATVTPAVQSAPKSEEENAVIFSSQSFTMEEKYTALSSEYRRMFDEIVRHALSKPNVKEYKHNGSFDYKDGSYKVLRMTIRRGEIVCEFHFINRDFINYASQANVKMKHSSTTIRVQGLATVGVIKDGIDLVCSQISADREYKKELARARRREKRRQQAEATVVEARYE